MGNRQASEFIPVDGAAASELADAAQAFLLADDSEGRSIVVLAKREFNPRGRNLNESNMAFIPFTAATRMSGVDYSGGEIRKYCRRRASICGVWRAYSSSAPLRLTPYPARAELRLSWRRTSVFLVLSYLKDIIKDGVREKFTDMRKMGIKSIMVTGDNPVTAAAIAAEAGDDSRRSLT